MALEHLHTALTSIKTLRSSVELAFDTFGNGIRADHGEDGKETNFLLELQELLSNVNNNLRDVEQAVNNLQSPNNAFSLGNTGYLSQESNQERQGFYGQLVLSYKWMDKVHEFSSLAHSLVLQNSLTRSYFRARKQRMLQTSSHNVPPTTVDKIIMQIDRVLPEMSVNITRPNASNVVLHVTVGRILKAIIAFKGLLIEWVMVHGFTEQLDLWTDSRYKVFQKVTENANAAMLRFYMPTMPEHSVKNFLTWLHSFNTLFSNSCKGCGLHLHNAMPPTWREFRTLEPYHEECKP